MKIQNIGFWCSVIGFLFYLFLAILGIETTGATAVMFFGLGLNLGALAVNNGGN